MQRTPGMPAGSGDDAVARQAAADASQAASDAAAAAANSRQMVLNRDPTLQSLQATADTAAAAITSSTADRLVLHQKIDALTSNSAPQAAQIAAAGTKADAATSAAATAGSTADAANAKADALATQVAALAAAVAASAKVVASGQGKTNTLLALGGSTDVVVPLSRTMPAAYNVEPVSISTGLIADSATITVKSKTPTAVTLTVVGKVALLANTVVSVIAWG